MRPRTGRSERRTYPGMYRMAGLFGALAFGATGLVFLLFPDDVIAFFNALSVPAGLKELPLQGRGFYLILAAGYMYLVTVLAFMMYHHPGNRLFPLLLAHGKLASSALSFFLLAAHGVYLMYIVNGILDGMIGAVAPFLYYGVKRDFG